MALLIRGLCKSYRSQIALDNINLTLEGGVVALLGANGSGKSTLLHILATLTQPDSGEIQFDDLSYTQHERQLRAQIGYLPQSLEFPETLTPRKLLTHLARLRNAPLDTLHNSAIEAILDRPFQKLSGGQQRLVGIAQAFLGLPRLLLLDEFVRGLDVNERENAFRMLRQSGKLLIFSTHSPQEIESVGAQQVLVLDRGQVLFCGSVNAMRSTATGFVQEICVSQEKVAEVSASKVVSRIIPNEGYTRLRILAPSTSTDETVVTPTLEDAYLWLMRRSIHN